MRITKSALPAAVIGLALVASPLPACAAPAAGVTTSTSSSSTSTSTSAVIVRATGSDLSGVTAAVARAGGHVTRTLRLVDAVAAEVPTAGLARLATTPGVREVTPNASVTLAGTTDPYSATGDANSLYNIETVVGARQMWSRGFTGKGVDVALLDSGVAPVPGIDTSRLVEGPDLTPESQNPELAHLDTYGHGTHMAGIIAGHDAAVTDVTGAAGNTTDFLGVAPDARIVSVKAADYRGASDVSQVIAGIDWVVQHAHDNGLNIKVLNLSFGTDSAQPYQLDPLAYAAEQAWRKGIAVVVSAGNSGAASGRLTDPATDPFLIAVGASDSKRSTSTNDDVIAPFSASGDGVRNPDVVAPGVHVQSLRVPGSYVDATYGATGALGDRYFRGSGTSQAAAVVSGAVALLMQARPDLTPDQVKYLLTTMANALPSADVQAQGNGLVSLRGQLGSAPTAPQSFAPSSGTGTLEASRGSTHLVATTLLGDVTLSGEKDLFGKAVDTAALARAEAGAKSWTGGTWNGSTWSGSTWGTSPTASASWSSSYWRDSSWASTGWSSSFWASSYWRDGSWSSSYWRSNYWASSYWRGAMWSDSTWQSSSWS